MTETIVEKSSCWNCIHCHSWSYPDTREDPGDSGWECQSGDENGAIKALEEKYGHQLESTAVISIASECPKYSYQTPETDYEPDELMTEAQLAELRAISEANDLQHCIDMGWYDVRTKEFTDEYYRASDRAYDASR